MFLSPTLAIAHFPEATRPGAHQCGDGSNPLAISSGAPVRIIPCPRAAMADKLRMPYHLGHPQKLVLDSMLQSLQPLGAVPIAEQSQADGDQRQGKRHHLSNSAGLWDAAVQRFSACRTDDAWVRSIQLPAAMDTTRSPPLRLRLSLPSRPRLGVPWPSCAFGLLASSHSSSCTLP